MTNKEHNNMARGINTGSYESGLRYGLTKLAAAADPVWLEIRTSRSLVAAADRHMDASDETDVYGE
jgi:hypothetical protein